MSVIGAGNLALGIVVLVAGIVSGILMIVGGARLLKGNQTCCSKGDTDLKKETGKKSPAVMQSLLCRVHSSADLSDVFLRGMGPVDLRGRYRYNLVPFRRFDAI